MTAGLPELSSLAELDDLVRRNPGLHVRFSGGPDSDASSGSIDTESGLQMPGLSSNTLDPESWWTRPTVDWLARQLCQYHQLAEQEPSRHAWVLRGRLVGRGPDSEPLLAETEPVARLSGGLLDEAERRYRREFDAERGPND